MNIYVCIKQVPETEAKLEPNTSKTYVDTSKISWIMNPYDEFAVESALQIKEKNPGSSVTAIRIGSEPQKEILRSALAVGVDDAIWVKAPDNLDSFGIAKAIMGAILKNSKKPDIIIMGVIGIDDNCQQVQSILGHLLNIPTINSILKFEQIDDNFIIEQEIDSQTIQIYELKTPFIFSCPKGINEPRYPTLPGIMKAKKKDLLSYSMDEVNVSSADIKINYMNLRLTSEKIPSQTFIAIDEKDQRAVVIKVAALLQNEIKNEDIFNA